MQLLQYQRGLFKQPERQLVALVVVEMNFFLLLLLLLLLALSGEVFANALVGPVCVNCRREVLNDLLVFNKLRELAHVQ